MRKILYVINDYLTTAQERDIESLLSFYADEVDYYGSGIVDKDFIKNDKISYFSKWTTVNSVIVGEPQINIQGNNIISVWFNTNWMVQNNKKTISGSAHNIWKFKKTDSGLKIVDEKQNIISRNR